MAKIQPYTQEQTIFFMSKFEIPNHWIVESAQFIFNEVRDGTHDSPKAINTGIPLVTSKNLESGKINFDNTSLISIEDHLDISKRSAVNYGDILFSMIGTIGNVAIVSDRIDFSIKNVALFRANDPILFPRFSFYWLISDYYQKYLETKKKGGNQKFVSLGVLRESPIPIAPLNEQIRIANKLDSLLAKVEAAQTRLDKISTLLKRFRQAVLAAATSGELTKDWRKDNAQDDILTLIECVNSKKEGKLKVRAKKGWKGDIILYELPENWAWISNHKLAEDSATAICAGPFGTIFKKKDFREKGIPIIFLRHVKEQGFNQNKPAYMDLDIWKEFHQEYSVSGGELLVNKLGDPPGESCIYPDGLGTAMVTPDVLKMNVDNCLAETKYLMYFFNSPTCKKMIGDLAFGVTRLRIDIAMFKNIQIPTPPREEQKQIVHQVESLFILADKVEKQYQQARQRTDKLTQSLLAKAFKGELVPQDPNDEPAEKLLARIQAEKEKLTPAKKSGGRGFSRDFS